MRTRHDHMHISRGGSGSQDATFVIERGHREHVNIPDAVKAKETGCAVSFSNDVVVNPAAGKSQCPESPLSQRVLNRADEQQVGPSPITACNREVHVTAGGGKFYVVTESQGATRLNGEDTDTLGLRRPYVRSHAQTFIPGVNCPYLALELYDFECKSQLNGVNGETTGLDDMSTINDQNKRMHLEAETSKHSKPIVNARNPERAAWRIAREERRKELERKQTQESARKVAEEENILCDKEKLVTDENIVGCLSFELCGERMYVVGGGAFRVTTTLSEQEIGLDPGEWYPLLLNKDRVTYSLNGRSLVTAPHVIVSKAMPAFSYKNVDGTTITKDKSEHSLFLPLYRLLQVFWQHPLYSLSVETAIRNYTTKALSECALGLSPDQYFELESIFEQTVQFYIYKIIARTQGIDIVQNVKPLKNAHHIFKTAWYNNYSVVQTDTYIKMNVKPRHLPRKEGLLVFDLKPNIVIANPQRWERDWVIPDSRTFEQSLLWDYKEPLFATDSEVSRNYVSVGLDLIPGCWDHSDVSDTRSLLDAVQKRLFSARENERQLWCNQQTWLADLASIYGEVDTEVGKLLNYTVEKWGDEYYYTSDPYWGPCRLQQHHPMKTRWVSGLDGCAYPVRSRGASPVLDFIQQFMHDTSHCGPQAVFDFMNTTARNVVDGLFSIYALGYSHFMNRYEYARLPGPKRQERMRTLDNVMYEPKTGVCQPVIALKAELDKLNFEKASRVFMSYGPKSSFLSPDLISIIKRRLSGRITKRYKMKNGEHVTVDCYTFTCPKTTDIEHLFKEMIDIDKTPNTIVFGCFSDDSVIAWNLPQGMGYANVDISSCDSSNGPLIFEIVYRMMKQLDPESAYYYLQQCKQKIRCENPQNRDQFFNILFPTCFEGSGTALTTLLNTVASALICAGIVEILMDNPDIDMDSCIKQGAALVGHKVTVDHCKLNGQYVPEKIQFLKFSPIRTTIGNYIPSRNLGCLIRGLGKIVGDLTPAQIGLTASSEEWKLMSASEKFYRYVSNIVAGYKNEASHPLLDGLRARFSHKVAEGSKYTQYLEVDGDYSSHTLDPASLLQRYEVDNETLTQSRNICLELRLGSVVQFPLFYTAMVQDYGMDKREASPTQGTFSNAGVDFRMLVDSR